MEPTDVFRPQSAHRRIPGTYVGEVRTKRPLRFQRLQEIGVFAVPLEPGWSLLGCFPGTYPCVWEDDGDTWPSFVTTKAQELLANAPDGTYIFSDTIALYRYTKQGAECRCLRSLCPTGLSRLWVGADASGLVQVALYPGQFPCAWSPVSTIDSSKTMQRRIWERGQFGTTILKAPDGRVYRFQKRQGGVTVESTSCSPETAVSGLGTLGEPMKYIVQHGDSPFSIAERFTGQGGRLGELLDANPHKARTQVNGMETFTSLGLGEPLNLPSSFRDWERKGGWGGQLGDQGLDRKGGWGMEPGAERKGGWGFGAGPFPPGFPAGRFHPPSSLTEGTFALVPGAKMVSWDTVAHACNINWFTPEAWPPALTQQATNINASSAPDGLYLIQYGGQFYSFAKDQQRGMTTIQTCGMDPLGSTGPYPGQAIGQSGPWGLSAAAPPFPLVAGAQYVDPTYAGQMCTGGWQTPSNGSWPPLMTTQATNINNSGAPAGQYFVYYQSVLYQFSKSGGNTTLQTCGGLSAGFDPNGTAASATGATGASGATGATGSTGGSLTPPATSVSLSTSVFGTATPWLLAAGAILVGAGLVYAFKKPSKPSKASVTIRQGPGTTTVKRRLARR